VFHCRAVRLCLFLAASVSLASARDLALVSNKTNTVTVMTVPDLIKICKAQTNRWPDGKPVTFIMRAPAVPEMRLLLEKVYGLPEAQVKELIVSANHGRANQVDVYAINSSVEVLKLAGKLPLEPGYLLHGD